MASCQCAKISALELDLSLLGEIKTGLASIHAEAGTIVSRRCIFAEYLAPSSDGKVLYLSETSALLSNIDTACVNFTTAISDKVSHVATKISALEAEIQTLRAEDAAYHAAQEAAAAAAAAAALAALAAIGKKK